MEARKKCIVCGEIAELDIDGLCEKCWIKANIETEEQARYIKTEERARYADELPESDFYGE